MLTWNAVGDDDDALAHTEGRPVPGVELRIDKRGEILARGPQLMLGYVDPTLDHRDDGWLATGDLGVVDNRGYLRNHRARQGHHHPQHGECVRAGGRGASFSRTPR